MAYSLAVYTDKTVNDYFSLGTGVESSIWSSVQTFRSELEAAVAKFTAAGLPDPVAMLQALDARIQGFENTIVDEPVAVKDPNKPYDRESLIREFMEEVYSVYLYLKQGVVSTTTNGVTTHSKNTGFTYQGSFANNDTGFAGVNNTTADQKIMKFYYDLINQTFELGDKLKNPLDDPSTTEVENNVWSVSSIPPFTYGGLTYDRVTSKIIGRDADDNPIYKTYFVLEGIDLSYVHKKPVKDQAGREVNFEFVFTDDIIYESLPSGTTDTRGLNNAGLLEVKLEYVEDTSGKRTLDIEVIGTVTIQKFRGMTPTEYLYFWNEARIKILKAQLAYKQALVQEVQEDLRQANAALAELENVANIRNLDKDGNYTNETSKETIIMHLFNARASNKGESLFNTNANDYTHNWGEWQTNRANLKAYVDRKSTQSQDMMLDYQQVLNRYNSSLEILSKLQEKMDGLIKSQIRNL